MSLIPTFEAGLWNAWILMLYFPLHPLIMVIIDKLVGTGNIVQKMGKVPHRPAEKRYFNLGTLLLLLMTIYAIFLPLKLGTVWFYAGLSIYLLGLVPFKVAIVNIATTPLGQPFTKGLYRYSRHPMTLSSSLTFIGVGIATASWLFLLLATAAIISWVKSITAEERGCCEQYGDAYREYLSRTPKWVGIPK